MVHRIQARARGARRRRRVPVRSRPGPRAEGAMSEADREKWERRYAPAERVMGEAPKAALLAWAEALPRAGRALDLAAGEGQTAAWLATRGLDVDAVDISPRALAKARALAEERGVSARVRTIEHDLDGGLPDGLAPGYDVVTCVHFWPSPALGAALSERVAPGGLLVLVALSAAAFAGQPNAPSARFLATPDAARALVPGFTVLACEDVALGGRPEVVLVARRPA
ncbi:MAG: methyltransferase domain-containing protein [Deltaproteobacteria bacterium]|nr:MAG: methyltransferase domain-containing protein [Deltaproteobacteria bacterium]